MPRRSVAEVERILDKTRLLLLCDRYGWRDRVVDWDNELDRRCREAEIEEAQKMVRRQIQLSFGLQEVATMELQALSRRIKAAEERAIAGKLVRSPMINVKDIVRLVECGTKLERLNRGEPDSIHGVEISGAHGGPVKIAAARTEVSDAVDRLAAAFEEATRPRKP